MNRFNALEPVDVSYPILLNAQDIETIVYCVGVTRGHVARGWLSEVDDELREQFRQEAEEFNKKLDDVLVAIGRAGQA